MDLEKDFQNNTIDWLMEEKDPGVRYLAMRDLTELPVDDHNLAAARKAAHQSGQIAKILNAMTADGYWMKPGPGYGPKYKSTVWAITLLAQLGAQIDEDDRIRIGCEYLLNHALAPGGQFGYNGTPSGTVDCLQGNLTWALTALGCADPRLEMAYEWMARTVTGEGLAPITEKKAEQRYYRYKCGPLFACGANLNQPCAWGGIKVMRAFGRLPIEKRTPLIERAIRSGVEFFFSIDPFTGEYPHGKNPKPSRDWWDFGFPLFYISDLLEVAEVLTALGYGKDPRLASTMDFITNKQDAQGRWPLEFDYPSKTWGNYGKKHEPNKWVTLRALRVIKAAAEQPLQ